MWATELSPKNLLTGTPADVLYLNFNSVLLYVWLTGCTKGRAGLPQEPQLQKVTEMKERERAE